jgi:hypothetical protein
MPLWPEILVNLEKVKNFVLAERSIWIDGKQLTYSSMDGMCGEYRAKLAFDQLRREIEKLQGAKIE